MYKEQRATKLLAASIDILPLTFVTSQHVLCVASYTSGATQSAASMGQFERGSVSDMSPASATQQQMRRSLEAGVAAQSETGPAACAATVASSVRQSDVAPISSGAVPTATDAPCVGSAA